MAILVKASKQTQRLAHVHPQGRVFSYSELKNIIGLPECRFVANEEICFVVNHCARKNCLPLNLTASVFYQLLADAPNDEYLYGNVLICRTKEMM